MSYIHNYINSDKKDILGLTLERGDFVIFCKKLTYTTKITKSPEDEFILGRIIDFSQKGIKVWINKNKQKDNKPLFEPIDTLVPSFFGKFIPSKIIFIHKHELHLGETITHSPIYKIDNILKISRPEYDTDLRIMHSPEFLQYYHFEENCPICALLKKTNR